MSEDAKSLSAILEAVLLAAGKPMTLDSLGTLFDEAQRPAPAQLRDALAVLGRSCRSRPYELKEVGSGYRLQIRKRFSPWVGRLWEERPPRYSRALLETLALIAYRQPVTRGEIEEVRGVAVGSQIIKTLQEREWIRVVGYRDVPGRPAMFATTRQFLDHFELSSLEQLPPLSALKAQLEEQADSLPPVMGLEEDYDDGEAPVPASLQARADEALRAAGDDEPVAVPEATAGASFRALLDELDGMEQGLKMDFDDLRDEEDA